MKDLKALYKECLAELDSIGIKYGEIVEVKISPKAQKRLGICKGHRPTPYSNWMYTIEISRKVLEDYVAVKVTKNVIIHEILHSCPDCRHHDAEWKALAQKVNDAYGYNISPTYKPEDFGLEPTPQKERKYLLVCTGCGKEVRRATESKVIKNYKKYRCARCGGKFERKS